MTPTGLASPWTRPRSYSVAQILRDSACVYALVFPGGGLTQRLYPRVLRQELESYQSEALIRPPSQIRM